MKSANPALITIARESREFTQSQLAKRMGISQSKLSKYENGDLQVSDEDLIVLANETGYTSEFFLQDKHVFGFGTICVFHRKKSSLSVRQLRRIQAKINILRMQTSRLLKDLQIETDRSLPELDIDQHGEPDLIARKVREFWRVPMGPILNLTSILERAGVIVQLAHFGTGRIDAVSQKIPGFPPIFMMNSDSPGDRLRFSLAHELGHVVMHRMSSTNMETEADRFASELLMPAAEIGPSLKNLRMESLPGLKSKWRVSMQAIIKRAADLGRISERHYRTLFTEISRNGWRRREPIPIEVENPSVLSEVLRVQIEEHRVGIRKLSEWAFLLNEEEFCREFQVESDRSFRIVG